MFFPSLLHRRRLSLVSLLVTLTSATSALASPTPASSPATARAASFLADHATQLGLDAVELEPRHELRGAGGLTVVRLGQTLDGIRVRGREVIVHVTSDDRVARVLAHVDRDLTRSTVPVVSLAEAQARLLRATGHLAAGAELVVDAARGGALVWELDAWDHMGPGRWFVDADTGELSGPVSLALHAQGRVYAMNPLDTPSPVDVPLASLDVAADPIRLSSADGIVILADYVSGDLSDAVLEQTLGPSGGEDFLYDPPATPLDPDDAFAQVNAFHHLERMRQLGAALGLPVGAPSWQIVVVTNFHDDGAPLDNAMFAPVALAGPITAPNTMLIGQGTLTDFAYDADVVLHEAGHYFTRNAVGYNAGYYHYTEQGRSPHSASVDEGIADYLACTENDDPEVGEAALAPLGALRDLEDTSKRCPDDMLGEPHADGEIVGSFSWSLRALLGRARADELVWAAVAALPEGATLGEYGRAVLAACDDMVASGTMTAAERAEIAGLEAARGLDECDQVIPLEPGETRVELTYGLTEIGAAAGYTCAELQDLFFTQQALFQLSRKTDAADTTLRFEIGAEAIGAGSPQFTVYLRKDAPVGYEGDIFDLDPVLFDQKLDVSGPIGEIVLTGTDFEPGAEYFVVLENRGCPRIRFSVTAETDSPGTTSSSSSTSTSGGSTTSGGSAPATSSSSGTGGEGGEGGAAAEPPEEDDGCSCRTTAAPGHDRTVMMLGLALAAVGAAARRLPRRRARSRRAP
ncbi:MAG: hypothetical protein JNL21_28380 [Myxococcales bacterium]|nr:hypothetical protein [Myxococcales bacterium]